MSDTKERRAFYKNQQVRQYWFTGMSVDLTAVFKNSVGSVGRVPSQKYSKIIHAKANSFVDGVIAGVYNRFVRTGVPDMVAA